MASITVTIDRAAGDGRGTARVIERAGSVSGKRRYSRVNGANQTDDAMIRMKTQLGENGVRDLRAHGDGCTVSLTSRTAWLVAAT